MWDDFKTWAGSPFAADMSALHWFYFAGLMLAIFATWRLIFLHIER